jgi:cell migration-inducing and hyaluronan-binding protein
VFNDKDGTITGVANSYIVNLTGIDLDDACEVKPTWNAAVCKGDVGRLAVNTPAPPGAPGAGGPPNLGAIFARPSGPPPPPVVLSRDGKELTLAGDTNVRAGTEIKVTTERPAVDLRLSEMDSGSWMIFELPGFTTAKSGAPQGSLEALRKASATSYYKGDDALWVKVVSNGKGARIAGPGAGGTSVEVSRQATAISSRTESSGGPEIAAK